MGSWSDLATANPMISEETCASRCKASVCFLPGHISHSSRLGWLPIPKYIRAALSLCSHMTEGEIEVQEGGLTWRPNEDSWGES